MTPYPVNSRIRVGEQCGSVVVIGKGEHGEDLPRPFYHVKFDGDDDTKIVLHEDIRECFFNGMPFIIVLVDIKTFAKFEADENAVTFQTVSAKKNGKIPPTKGKVIYWRDHYWITTGGAWMETDDPDVCERNDAFTLSYVEIEMVIPRAEWKDEIRAPHFTHGSHRGYVVTAPDGDYVCADIVAHIAPMPQASEKNSQLAISNSQWKLF
jgi:hypothetical protein